MNTLIDGGFSCSRIRSGRNSFTGLFLYVVLPRIDFVDHISWLMSIWLSFPPCSHIVPLSNSSAYYQTFFRVRFSPITLQYSRFFVFYQLTPLSAELRPHLWLCRRCSTVLAIKYSTEQWNNLRIECDICRRCITSKSSSCIPYFVAPGYRLKTDLQKSDRLCHCRKRGVRLSPPRACNFLSIPLKRGFCTVQCFGAMEFYN